VFVFYCIDYYPWARPGAYPRGEYIKSALAGSGRLWQALAGSGRLWEALGGSGRLWEVLSFLTIIRTGWKRLITKDYRIL
jgi:hypothetical protein